jgi:hypothetical protein
LQFLWTDVPVLLHIKIKIKINKSEIIEDHYISLTMDSVTFKICEK